MIVGYFIDKGKKIHDDASRASDKLSCATQDDETCQVPTVKSSTVISNQTSLPNSKAIHLTAALEDNQPHALQLGIDYEKLLQDEKSVAGDSTTQIDYKKVHDDVSSDRSHDTTTTSTGVNRKEITPSLTSRHGSRHKQVMVTRTAQPVIASSSSKNKKAKPLCISHKLKEKIDEGKAKIKEDLVTQQSPIKLVPAIKPEYGKPTINTTHLNIEAKVSCIAF